MRLLITLGILSTLFNWWTSHTNTATIADTSVTCISDRERDSLVLVALYESTDGADWSTIWNLRQPIDTWFGVTINEDGCVDQLTLAGNNLVGSLPPELGQLTNLTNLLVHYNQLSGEIPSELGQLSNLTLLWLSYNQLSGAIPSELGQLSNLKELFLSYNQLSGSIPPELGQLNNLTIFNSGDNQISGNIPSELGQLNNLTRLDFRNNRLSGEIPPELGQLSSLISLIISDNELSGNIPLELGQLTNLTSLRLNENQLSGELLSELGQLSSLTHLVLGLNQLSGNIPSELGQLVNLIHLDFQDNQLSGEIPPELTQLVNLDWLRLNDNQLSGTIPPELGGLTNLTQIYLANNQLSGCYSSALDIFCNLASVDAVTFDDGYDFKNNPDLPWQGDFERFCNGEDQIGAPCADGTVAITADCNCPEVILNPCRERDSLALVALYESTDGANWTIPWDLNQPIDTWYGVNLNEEGCVECLNLSSSENGACNFHLASGNNLVGTIPSELGQLSDLVQLLLNHNQLSGEIPKELGELSNLILIYLHENQLSGSIPKELGELSPLRSLWIYKNRLSGEIPPELGQLPNLISLRLSSNQLDGGIPPELGQLSNLSQLELGGNNLSGEIPTQLGNLDSLHFLTLSSNQLSGPIPAELGQLTNLVVLELFDNQLSNSIPPELGQLINLEELYLWSNELSGEIPPELGQLVNLLEFSVDENQLSGSIPAELGQLTNLVWFYLNDNQLSGNIPAELGRLTNLIVIYLSNNQLSGCYDSALDVFCNLASVDASSFDEGYDFKNNPSLPWQGDFERFCNGEDQIGAPCADGSVTITADCNCPEVLSTTCRERDSLALVALYESTDGANWTIPWDLNQPMDTWFGVNLNEEGCVECLNLAALDCYSNADRGNNLVGTIPSELGQLYELTRLNLSRNQLSGTIPSELGQLTNLTSLRLSSNQLIGAIPSELGQLSNLRFLLLNGNQLSGTIPSELGQLVNLSELLLYDNQLSGSIPSELSQLLNLEELYLNKNELIGEIPFELGQLTKLEDLRLNDNQLSGTIPSELGQLTNLTQFYLASNQLSGCYDSALDVFCNLPSINTTFFNGEGYDFKNNPSLPWQGDFERFCNGEDQIGAPCADETVAITADCNCPEVILNPCRERDSLALVALYESTDGANWITTWDLNAPMDTWFGVHLNIDGCVECLNLANLDGSCPIGAERGNDLVGLLPPELGQLSDLVRLNLDRNNLSGLLPPELGQLSKLEYLFFGDNQLSGEIPPTLGQLSNLVQLSLSQNQLSGKIPAELGQLQQLRIASFNRNQLSGEIPQELGQLSVLNFLSIQNNQLSGEIPPELGQLTNLEDLRLTNNQLSGEIPSELGLLVNLNTLYLSNNELSGCYDSALEIFCNIASVNAATNADGYDFKNNPSLPWQGDFERFCNGEDQIGAPCADGSVTITADCSCPEVILNPCRERDSLALVALYESTDGANWTTTWDLNAPMDTWFGVNLNEEGCVDILTSQNNNLSGEISSELGQLSELTLLNLNNNQLSGGIPFELGQLVNLTELFLNSNQLSGEISSELGQLSELTRLDLNNNQLSGGIPFELGQLPNLIHLFLYNNQFTGTIPPELGQLSSLTLLDFGSNQLSGEIPSELGQLTDLTRFYLDNNHLSGCYNNALEVFCNFVSVDGDTYDEGYDFKNNPSLPWQGDFERYCLGEEQIGAPCDDGNPETTNERILEDCTCGLFSPNISSTEACNEMAFQIQLTGQGVPPYTCEWEALSNTNTSNSVSFDEDEWIVMLNQGGTYVIQISDSQGLSMRDTIAVRGFPKANTMPNYHECEASTLITANLPEGTTGQWLGTGIEDPTGEESSVQLEYGLNTFVWSLSKEECLEYSSDTLVIFREGHPIVTKDAYCLSVAQDTLALPLINNDDVAACSDYIISFSDAAIENRLTEAKKGTYHFRVERPNEILEFEYTVCNVVCPDFCAMENVYLEIVPTIGNVLAQPIGITPNGDGLNDMFIIKDLEINTYPQQELLIFNQWGQVIYQASPYLNNWEGRYENGQPATEGTYYYILRLGTGEQERVGRILVLR